MKLSERQQILFEKNGIVCTERQRTFSTVISVTKLKIKVCWYY